MTDVDDTAELPLTLEVTDVPGGGGGFDITPLIPGIILLGGVIVIAVASPFLLESASEFSRDLTRELRGVR